MRIVSRAELLKLPPGTVYSEYEPCYFRDLSVKVDTWENDWLYDSLFVPLDTTSDSDYLAKCDVAERGEDVPLDFHSTSRDGTFDDKQLYAVFSPEDVEKLIARLQEALTP